MLESIRHLTLNEWLALIFISWAITIVARFLQAKTDEERKRLERQREAVPIMIVMMTLICYFVYRETHHCADLLQQILSNQDTIMGIVRP